MLKIITVLFLLIRLSPIYGGSVKVLNSNFLKNFISLSSNQQLKKFKKNVWSEIVLDQKVNHPFFKPYNAEIPGYDHITNEVNIDFYKTKKDAIKWNLYTIITSEFIKGDLNLFSPFNPDWEEEKDNGYLTYPISRNIDGKSEKANYQNNKDFKYWVKAIYLGKEIFDPFAAPLVSYLYPDEDSVMMGADGFEVAVYPPNDYIWFKDSDVIKYKLKETWVMGKNGKVKNKIIDAIAPVIYRKDSNGKILGERTLFWVNFSELLKKLTIHHIALNRYKKEEIISLADFFNRREFYAANTPDTNAVVKPFGN
ncbi:MAG: hypothetical protein AB8B72_14240 [Crocinitomicaceae bacterium]